MPFVKRPVNKLPSKKFTRIMSPKAIRLVHFLVSMCKVLFDL